MSQLERSLVKRAVKLSLDDLKANHSGDFLSSRALQVNSYLIICRSLSHICDLWPLAMSFVHNKTSLCKGQPPLLFNRTKVSTERQ